MWNPRSRPDESPFKCTHCPAKLGAAETIVPLPPAERQIVYCASCGMATEVQRNSDGTVTLIALTG